MANTTSARKAARKIARRTAINKSRRTRVAGAVRKVEAAINDGVLRITLPKAESLRPHKVQVNTK